MTRPQTSVIVVLGSVASMVVFAIVYGGIMALKTAAKWEIEQNEKNRVVNYYVPESPQPHTGAK